MCFFRFERLRNLERESKKQLVTSFYNPQMYNNTPFDQNVSLCGSWALTGIWNDVHIPRTGKQMEIHSCVVIRVFYSS